MRQLYIDGEWVVSQSSTGIDVVSPVSGEVIDTVPHANEQDVAAAVDSALGLRRNSKR